MKHKRVRHKVTASVGFQSALLHSFVPIRLHNSFFVTSGVGLCAIIPASTLVDRRTHISHSLSCFSTTNGMCSLYAPIVAASKSSECEFGMSMCARGVVQWDGIALLLRMYWHNEHNTRRGIRFCGWCAKADVAMMVIGGRKPHPKHLGSVALSADLVTPGITCAFGDEAKNGRVRTEFVVCSSWKIHHFKRCQLNERTR